MNPTEFLIDSVFSSICPYSLPPDLKWQMTLCIKRNVKSYLQKNPKELKNDVIMAAIMLTSKIFALDEVDGCAFPHNAIWIRLCRNCNIQNVNRIEREMLKDESYQPCKLESQTYYDGTPKPKINTPRMTTPTIYTPQINTPTIYTPRINTSRLNTPINTPINTPMIYTPRIYTPRITPRIETPIRKYSKKEMNHCPQCTVIKRNGIRCKLKVSCRRGSKPGKCWVHSC